MRMPTAETVVHVSGFSYLNNRDRLLDELLDARHAAVALESSVRRLEYFPGDESELIDLLRGMDGKATTAQAGIGLVLATHWQDNRYTLTAAARTRFAGTFEYVASDEPKLRLAPVVAFIELAKLESRVRVSGYGVAEVALHRRMDEIVLPATRITLSVKHQEYSLYERDVPIQDYRESDLFKLGDYSRRFSRPNLSVASVTDVGDWRLGLAIENLVPDTLRGLQSTAYRIRPQATVQIGYQLMWGSANLYQDLNSQPAFGQVSERRETALKFDMPLGKRFVIGAGYQYVAKGRDDDAFSLSLSYRLPDSFYLGVSATAASRHEFGGAFRIQLPLF